MTSRKLKSEFFTLPKEPMYSALFTNSPLEWTLVSVKSSARMSCKAAASWAITAFIQVCCRARISRSSGPNGLRSTLALCCFISIRRLMAGRPLWIKVRRNDCAITHMNDAVAELGCLGIVGDHQDGLSEFLVRLAQHVQYDIGIFGIEISRG